VDDGGNSACSTWFDSRTALLNSSSSAVSHSSSNVDVSGEQYPRRRARSITELMRWRSDALVKPRHALAAYVRRATTLVRYIDVLQSRSVQSVAAQHPQRGICLCARRHESLNVLSDREVVCNGHTQHLHAAAAHDSWLWCRFSSMPSPPPTVCKTISHDLSQFYFRLFRLAQFCTLTSSI